MQTNAHKGLVVLLVPDEKRERGLLLVLASRAAREIFPPIHEIKMLTLREKLLVLLTFCLTLCLALSLVMLVSLLVAALVVYIVIVEGFHS